jgi:putative addiction module killer protein
MVYRSPRTRSSEGDRRHCSNGAGQRRKCKGSWIWSIRIRSDLGPGYRIYFGKDGEQIIILLGGGTKKRQQNDINPALARWQDYKQRKKAGEK